MDPVPCSSGKDSFPPPLNHDGDPTSRAVPQHPLRQRLSKHLVKGRGHHCLLHVGSKFNTSYQLPPIFRLPFCYLRADIKLWARRIFTVANSVLIARIRGMQWLVIEIAASPSCQTTCVGNAGENS